MPNEFVRSDSRGQIEYFIKNAESLESVKAVLIRKSSPFAFANMVHKAAFAAPFLVAGSLAFTVVNSFKKMVYDNYDRCVPDLTLEYEPGMPLKVISLRKDSEAAQMGLENGDLILEVNGNKIADYREFAESAVGDYSGEVAIKAGRTGRQPFTVNLRRGANSCKFR